jgi:hypothetical protein
MSVIEPSKSTLFANIVTSRGIRVNNPDGSFEFWTTGPELRKAVAQRMMPSLSSCTLAYSFSQVIQNEN